MIRTNPILNGSSGRMPLSLGRSIESERERKRHRGQGLIVVFGRVLLFVLPSVFQAIPWSQGPGGMYT